MRCLQYKMRTKIKKEVKMMILLLLFIGIFLIGNTAAVTCCEKTTAGAWCQNVNDESQCATGTNPLTGEPYRKISAFCDATSYCRPGTCINNQEGTCISSPQIVCEGNYGFWSDKTKDQLPQCQLGCCLVGDQAAFVTQVSCNRFASLYGLEVNYRTDVNNELSCLASANPTVKGACVYTKDYVKTCEIATKQECQNKQKTSASSDFEFHEGYLCSAQELETVCAKSQKTRCEGDDVYFVDTCGNLANIYDSSKVDNENYWTFIQDPVCSDSGNPGNKNSPNCGDCDYFSGSMCQEKAVGDSVNYGDFLCKDLDCTNYRGAYSGSPTGTATANNFPQHGETWCANDATDGNENSPGATYYRLLCYNGDVTVEICDTTRQKICAEEKDEESGRFFGNCKVNVWQDCTAQTTKEDCENENVRDCVWVQEDGGQKISEIYGGISEPHYYYFSKEGLKNDKEGMGACVPKYSPGFARDGSNTAIGGEMCNQATTVCKVKEEKGLLDSGYHCVDNCYCKDSEWVESLNNICSQLGDCGSSVNYIGTEGQAQKALTKKKID